MLNEVQVKVTLTLRFFSHVNTIFLRGGEAPYSEFRGISVRALWIALTLLSHASTECSFTEKQGVTALESAQTSCDKGLLDSSCPP
jgi:uncharacterized membrane protein